MKKIVLSLALCLSITPIVSQEAKGDISPEASERIARFSFNFLFGFVAGAYYEELHDKKPRITHSYKEVPIVVGGELVNQVIYPVVFASNNQKYSLVKPHHECDFLGRGLGRALAAIAASGTRKQNGEKPHINIYNVINTDLVLGSLGLIGKQLSNWYRSKPEEKDKSEKTELVLKYQPETTTQPKKEEVVTPIAKPLESEIEQLRKQLKPKERLVTLTDAERKEHNLSSWWDWE